MLSAVPSDVGSFDDALGVSLDLIESATEALNFHLRRFMPSAEIVPFITKNFYRSSQFVPEDIAPVYLVH